MYVCANLVSKKTIVNLTKLLNSMKVESKWFTAQGWEYYRLSCCKGVTLVNHT